MGTDDEYENDVDDEFRPSFQQPSQPANHGLEKNLSDEDKNAFISDYQSDPKSSRRHKFLKEKRIDLEMLQQKNRNLQLWNAMKRARIFSGPEESSIRTPSPSIKRLKKEEIYYSTDYTNFRSFCHPIESSSEGCTLNERYKQAKQFLAIKEFDS